MGVALFVHICCLTLIVAIYIMQFGSRPDELEVQIRLSLQNNREYILDNPNMIRGVWAGNKCTDKLLTFTVACGYFSPAFLTTFDLLF